MQTGAAANVLVSRNAETKASQILLNLCQRSNEKRMELTAEKIHRFQFNPKRFYIFI